MIIPTGQPFAHLRAAAFGFTMACAVAGCGSAPELPPAEQPLAKETLDLLGKRGMQAHSPIFIRIFKEESELEVWKARDDGRFYHFKTYPICNWSGDLGPKIAKGDKQAPEGFYTIAQNQMNPNSNYYLAFNIGFPNAYDRANNRTGEFLMVHGKCKSAGCYAMTDALAEEIYGLAREAFRGGQQSFQVHAFPFRMTNEKLDRFRKHRWYTFWTTLKQGYDYFEIYRTPPQIAVCERRYVVDVVIPASTRVDPVGRCPQFQRPLLQPFAPQPYEQQMANERVTVPGPRTRDAAAVASAAALDTTPVADPGIDVATTTGAINPFPVGASALGFSGQ